MNLERRTNSFRSDYARRWKARPDEIQVIWAGRHLALASKPAYRTWIEGRGFQQVSFIQIIDMATAGRGLDKTIFLCKPKDRFEGAARIAAIATAKDRDEGWIEEKRAERARLEAQYAATE
jgi:hypothetical protein